MNNLIFNCPLISSKSNNTVVEISKLSAKKHRMASKLFMCDGIKLFEEAFNSGNKIRYIILDNEADVPADIAEKIKKAEAFGAKILCVAEHVFEKLTSENAPQGIITVCEFFEGKHSFSAIVENEDIAEKTVVALESVRDPGNMGTIIRNAVAFGIDTLIISSDCADIYSQKVIRASMGGLFKINIRIVDSLVDTVKNLIKSGRRVLAAALDDNAKILGKESISGEDVVVLGNEGHGISDELLTVCTDKLLIPMKGETESLNVAMASAIIMWEISK